MCLTSMPSLLIESSRLVIFSNISKTVVVVNVNAVMILVLLVTIANALCKRRQIWAAPTT